MELHERRVPGGSVPLPQPPHTHRLDVWYSPPPLSWSPITSEGCWLFTLSTRAASSQSLPPLQSQSVSLTATHTYQPWQKHANTHRSAQSVHISQATDNVSVATVALKDVHTGTWIPSIYSLWLKQMRVLQKSKSNITRALVALTHKDTQRKTHDAMIKHGQSRKLHKCNSWNRWLHAGTENHSNTTVRLVHCHRQIIRNSAISIFAAHALFTAERL